MIYLINNQNNTITTDSWLDYIPTDLLVYLDDILVGTYSNLSSYNEYIQLSIPSTDLVNLQNKEYLLKLYNNLSLLKVELVTVKSDIQNTVTSLENNNKIIMLD